MKKLLLALLGIMSGFSFGCLPKEGSPSFLEKIRSKPINLAGVIENYPRGTRAAHPWKPFKTFNPVPAGTLHTKTEEFWYRRNFSGTQTKVLWGLFTLTDY